MSGVRYGYESILNQYIPQKVISNNFIENSLMISSTICLSTSSLELIDKTLKNDWTNTDKFLTISKTTALVLGSHIAYRYLTK